MEPGEEMILIDTSPIVAFLDGGDKYHSLCMETLRTTRESLATTWSVLTESFYLLDFSSGAQSTLWDLIEKQVFTVLPIPETMYPRCRELMLKYRDLPMDLADATLVTVGEEHRISTIFTLDHKDFSLYRPNHRHRFILLPSQL